MKVFDQGTSFRVSPERRKNIAYFKTRWRRQLCPCSLPLNPAINGMSSTGIPHLISGYSLTFQRVLKSRVPLRPLRAAQNRNRHIGGDIRVLSRGTPRSGTLRASESECRRTYQDHISHSWLVSNLVPALCLRSSESTIEGGFLDHSRLALCLKALRARVYVSTYVPLSSPWWLES